MFQFDKDYVLKNEVVELSPLKLSHELELFYESNDPEIWQHFIENGFGQQNFKKYIENAVQKRDEGKQYPLVIKDLRNNQLAGITRVYEVDNILKNAKVGHTWIGKRFQRTGLNKACKYLLFEFLFEKIKMKRIGFGASSLNTISIKAMLSIGCKIEGELRSFLPVKGTDERANIVLLSILKEEWTSRAKQNLENRFKAI